MSLPVIWSPEAQDDYADLLAYVEAHFGLDAALKVLDKTDLVVQQIAIYPKLFPATGDQEIRKAVISKHTSLLYIVESQQIQLLHFWDNRQDPEKMNLG